MIRSLRRVSAGAALLVVFIIAGLTGACRRPPSAPPAANDASTQMVPASRYPMWLRSAMDQKRATVALTSRSTVQTAGFEQNVGQFDGDAKFIARTATGVMLLRPNALSAVVGPAETLDQPAFMDPAATPNPTPHTARIVDVRLIGAGGQPNLRPIGLLPRTNSYFSGADPKRWQRDVPSFERIRYEQIYPNIDLAVYQSGDDVKYDFLVAPGASAASIQLKVEGADRVQIDSGGDLVIRAGDVELRHRKPTIYQDAAGSRRTIDGGFVERAGAVGFRIGDYDPRLPLVIDPTIVQRYSTTLTGGIGHAQALAVAVAPDGDVFVTGWANTFNSTGAFTKDAFVAWFDGTTGALTRTAFFGGKKSGCGTPNLCDSDDAGAAIAVDGTGSIYVTGKTQSIGFPVTADAFDPDCGDDKLCGRGVSLQNPVKSDAFVLKLERAGTSFTLTWGTYLGGGVDDAGTGIAVDAVGTIYVTGWTHSGTFPVKAAAQAAWNGGFDGFVVALAPTAANKLVFGTYLGSAGDDFGTAIVVDPIRNLVFVAGHTSSAFATPAFPATDPAGTSPGGGGSDAFVAEYDTSGKFLIGTYIRGSNDDRATGIAIDASGHVYVSGTTSSSNLNGAGGPTAGGADAFVAKLHFVRKFRFTFAVLDFVTLLGGSDEDRGSAIAVDAQGRAYITGMTRSTNFPTAGQLQAPLHSTKLSGISCGTQHLSCPDVFAGRFTSAGALDYVALFGGQDWDAGNGIALRHAGDAVIASESFVTIPSFQNPVETAIVTRITSGADLAVSKTCSPTPAHAGHPLTCTLTITNNGPEALTSTTLVDTVSPPTWYDALTISGSPCSTFTNAQGFVTKVTCPVQNLAVNGTRTLTYPFVPATKGTLQDHLAVDFADDWNPGNNSADLSITVEADSDLNAFKAHVPEPTPLGSETKYELWVGNQGPDLATNVQIQDSVPAGLEILSVTTPAGTCSPTQGTGPLTITCNVGPLVQPQGLSGVQAVGVQIRARATAAGTLSNTATVSGLITDSVPANDTATDPLTVRIGTPKVSVHAQAVARMPTAGGLNVQLEMEFTNTGDGNALTVRTTQLDAVNVVGTGTVTRVGGLPLDIPLLEVGQAKSRLPTFLVTAGATQFDVVFQGDYEDASGSGTKFPLKGKVTIVP